VTSAERLDGWSPGPLGGRQHCAGRKGGRQTFAPCVADSYFSGCHICRSISCIYGVVSRAKICRVQNQRGVVLKVKWRRECFRQGDIQCPAPSPPQKKTSAWRGSWQPVANEVMSARHKYILQLQEIVQLR